MHLFVHSILVLASLAVGSFTLPAPTGDHFLAATSRSIDGESILLWYPSKRGHLKAPYVSREVLAALEKDGYYGQSVETMSAWRNVVTHSIEGGVPAPGRYPLIVFLPGAGVCGFQYTAFAEELSSHGYVVAIVDYYSPKAPKRSYNDEDSDAATDDIAKVASNVVEQLVSDPVWKQRIDPQQVGVMGHSIGGSAAIVATRLNPRFRAALDMDGGVFGDAKKGAVAPLLVLRSKPIYSDEELAKRGRSRKDFERLGQEARRSWLDFVATSSNPRITIYSVLGTGHFSFSDAPYTMPDAITRFGGKIIDRALSQKIVTTCTREFFARELRTWKDASAEVCSQFQEITSGIPAANSKD